jgi:hypothetical protein
MKFIKFLLNIDFKISRVIVKMISDCLYDNNGYLAKKSFSINKNNENLINFQKKNQPTLNQYQPVINLIVKTNQDGANSAVLKNLKPILVVKMPVKKIPKPKLYQINSKEKVSKSVCSSSQFVSSITSGLVNSKTSSSTTFFPFEPMSLSSQKVINKFDENMISLNLENIDNYEQTQEKLSNENRPLSVQKLGTCNQISKFLAFKDLRKSFRSLIESNSEKNNPELPINTGKILLKKQSIENGNRNFSKFSMLNLNKTFSFKNK